MRGRTGRGRGFICDSKVIEGGLVWGVMEYPRIRVNGHGIGGKGGQRWEWEWGQSIPPSNHKNSTSAFHECGHILYFDMPLQSIAPRASKSPTCHPPSIPPQTSAPNTHGIPIHVYPRHHQESNTYKSNPSKSTCAMAKCKANCLSRNAVHSGLGFSQTRKRNDKKNKRQESQPTPFLCVPSQPKRSRRKKNAKFDTTTQCMLPVLSKREREREKKRKSGSRSVCWCLM